MPLTTTGIAIQILSSVKAYKENREHCSTNDCKVVVNHLIRKYSEPLFRENRLQRQVSISVSMGNSDDTIEDHAVPVIVLLEDILEWGGQRLEINNHNINALKEYLESSLLLVTITREEDLAISNAGFQRRMPEGWSQEGHNLYRNPLSRYVVSGVNV